MQGKKQADLVQPLGMGSAASLNNKFSGSRWDADDLIIVGRETNSRPGFLLSDGQFLGYDEMRKQEGNEKMHWKANARYNEPIEESTIFSSKQNPHIIIHKLHGLGNGFYLSCSSFRIANHDLKTEDFAEAVKKSQTVIADALIKYENEFRPFISDESKQAFTRY